MLAGTGKGKKSWRSSPAKEMAMMMPNCKRYFMEPLRQELWKYIG